MFVILERAGSFEVGLLMVFLENRSYSVDIEIVTLELTQLHMM